MMTFWDRVSLSIPYDFYLVGLNSNSENYQKVGISEKFFTTRSVIENGRACYGQIRTANKHIWKKMGEYGHKFSVDGPSDGRIG